VPFILPDIILLDEYRPAAGFSMEVRYLRLEGKGAPANLNSGVDLADVSGSPATGTLSFALREPRACRLSRRWRRWLSPSRSRLRHSVGQGEEMQAAGRAGRRRRPQALIVKQTAGGAGAGPITVPGSCGAPAI